MPLIRRLPKRGFNNDAFRNEYLPINLEKLNSFNEGTIVYEPLLRALGVASGKKKLRIKILSVGELTKKLHVKAAKFSAAAKAAIEKMGGTAEMVP